MPYDYDAQIAELLKFPRRISEHWSMGWGLFQFCTRSGKKEDLHPLTCCGCLTFVKTGRFVACDPKITHAIHCDSRLPADILDVVADPARYLPVFKQWQVGLDKILKRGDG